MHLNQHGSLVMVSSKVTCTAAQLPRAVRSDGVGKTYAEIQPELAAWMLRQHLFFVATAPLADDGLVNCSPKGLNCFTILDPHTVAYLDFNGSGVETIAHLRENGRIVLMFCALEGAPKIVRLHGTGMAVEPQDADFGELRAHFGDAPQVRSIIRVDVSRISDSCGFGVPLYEYVGEREALPKWSASKSAAEMAQYQAQKNRLSIDALPGLRAVAVAES